MFKMLTTRYVCDPVLGDHGRYYVPAELVDIFRERVIPRRVICVKRSRCCGVIQIAVFCNVEPI